LHAGRRRRGLRRLEMSRRDLLRPSSSQRATA